MKIMISIIYQIFIFSMVFFMGSFYVSAYEVNLKDSGITVYFPSCVAEKEASLCIDRIEIDKEKRVFITVKSDFDSSPEFQSKELRDTSSKVKVATFVMRSLIEKLNPRVSEEFNYQGEMIPLMIEGASTDNIVILMMVDINKRKYSGFSYFNDDGELVTEISETKLNPGDYFYSEVQE
ncbi:hypothetical protein [Vibrio bivalvicida]|uniref:Uncharacterized protein n=1 Tax=Vibrio bivalvicida TaxID=1276888 RepID=A0ABV4MGH6_9VIBR